MKLKKNKLILVIIAVGLAFTTYFVLLNINNTRYVSSIENYTGNAKMLDDYMNEQDLLNKASYILEGKIVKKEEPYKYGSVMYEIIHFEVADVLYSEKEVGNEILILRESEMFTPLEENEDYILYLYDYIGPVASDVKMVCGANIGALKLTNDSSNRRNESGNTLSEYKEYVKNYVKENR